MTTTTLRGIGYRADLKKPQNPDLAFDNLRRNYDVGALTIEEDRLHYVANGKPEITLFPIRRVEKKNKNCIRVEYGNGLKPHVAYFGFIPLFRRNRIKLLNEGLLRLRVSSAIGEAERGKFPEIAVVQSICRYVVLEKRQRSALTDIGEKLQRAGLGPDAAQQIVQSLAQSTKPARGGLRNLLFGALWFVGGLVVTIATYNAASSGGSYVVAYGAILFGLGQALVGLGQYLSAPRSEKALVKNVCDEVLQSIEPGHADEWQLAAARIGAGT